MTRAFCIRILAAALVAASFRLVAARAATAPESVDFAALLTDAGVDLNALAAIAHDGSGLSPELTAMIDQVCYRLNQLDRRQLRGPAPAVARATPGAEPWPPGTLVRLDGEVKGRRGAVESPSGDAEPLWRYDVEMAGGGNAIVISRHAPRAWIDRDDLHERVSAVGAWVGATGDAPPRPVVIVNRFRWFPNAGVPSGVAWLAAQGFDAALFDDVRPASALAKPHESRESEAFYEALAAVARGDAAQLQRLAREELDDAVGRWRHAADQEPADADPARRNARIAAAVARSAERGLSSVGPMYLAPAETMGRLVLLEGVARRAVRIVVDEATAPDDLAEYYEVDLFTPDSENLPVICAVARLPQGFPTGDRIHQPVRAAGVFFKRWAYVARPDAASGQAARRIAAPLVLVAEVEWLRADAAPASARSLWWGLGFVALLAAIWLTAARMARSDRLARSRRTGYDARSHVDLGPPSAET